MTCGVDSRLRDEEPEGGGPVTGWMAVRQRLRRSARRRRVTALTLCAAVFAVVAGLWISAGQDPAADLVTGPGVSSDGAVESGTRSEDPPTEPPGDGTLAQFDREFGAIERSEGRAVLTVEAPSGIAIEVPLEPALADELRDFAVVARTALACDPDCGTAEVIAEYRPVRLPSGTVREEFARPDGVSVARMDASLDVLRFEIGPWIVSVLLGNIPTESIKDWAFGLPLLLGATGWVGVGDVSSQFRPLDEKSSSVELNTMVNHVQIAAKSCTAALEGISNYQLDDGGTSAYGTVCLEGDRFTLTADSEAGFVARVVAGIRPR